MATTQKIAATGKSISDIIETLTHYAPFFDSSIRYVSKNSNYACLLCDDALVQNDAAGISYANATERWAHPDCLRAVASKLDAKHMPLASLSTDAKARKKASKAFYERQATIKAAARAEKPAATTTPAASIDTTALREQIRDEIEKEYEDDIDAAINLITTQRDKIAALEEKLRLSQADYAAMYEKATALQAQLSRIVATSVADLEDKLGSTPAPTQEASKPAKTAPKLTDEQRAARRAMLAKAS